jgi:tetraacyldisaccharide 4'-kinase
VSDARGPLPHGWLAPATWLAARAYEVGVRWRNARFDRGNAVARLDAAPVISVGNLSAGGTGKSPLVAWVAEALADAGVHPVIALRGYGAARPEDSDEAREYAVTAPTARVVVGARRLEALTRAFAGRSGRPIATPAVVVLDDGFQHRMLARDLDIVLVDATRPALDGDLLPNGWLREPARGLARADLVVLTKAHDPTQRARAAALVARWRGAPPDAVCDHAWRALEVHDADGTRAAPRDWLNGKRALSACALGNPRQFHAMVARATGAMPAVLERRDHAAIAVAELDEAVRRSGAEVVVTSRKDFVKLEGRPSVPLAVPVLALDFLEGESTLRDAINAAARRACGSSRENPGTTGRR